MKHLLKRIAASKSNVVAHIRMGNDVVNLATRDNKYLCLFNGHDLWSFSSTPATVEKTSNIVRDLLARYLSDSKPKNLSVLKNKESCDYDPLLSDLKETPGFEKIVVKFLPNDTTDIEKSLRPDFDIERAVGKKELINAIQVMSKILNETCTVLCVCREDALSITSGRLVNTMWGAKTMQHTINSLNKEISENDNWEKVEFYTSLILRSAERLAYKLSTELSDVCAEEKKIISTVLIPNIVSNYEQFKRIVAEALMSLSTLMYIDVAFKKMTSYPATWFLSGGMLDDLRNDYQKLIGFLFQIPRLEKEVIYPLDILKLQYSSEIKK